jgi:hypothetical protein
MLNFIKRQVDLYRFLRDIERYSELERKYREVNIKLYHARCELGPEGWLKVMELCRQYPTTESILAKYESEN